jgi:hypothetical protein
MCCGPVLSHACMYTGMNVLHITLLIQNCGESHSGCSYMDFPHEHTHSAIVWDDDCFTMSTLVCWRHDSNSYKGYKSCPEQFCAAKSVGHIMKKLCSVVSLSVLIILISPKGTRRLHLEEGKWVWLLECKW